MGSRVGGSNSIPELVLAKEGARRNVLNPKTLNPTLKLAEQHRARPSDCWVVGLGQVSSFRGGLVDVMGDEQGSTLLTFAFARDFLRPEQDEAVVRVAQVSVAGQSERNSSDFSQEAGRVDLVERVL